MSQLCLTRGCIAYGEVDRWIRIAEEHFAIRILFAGAYGSRPMAMATPASDRDIYAVHAAPVNERLLLTLEHEGQSCDIVSWSEAMAMTAPNAAQAEKGTRYPRYDFRTAAQHEARRGLPPIVEPQEHVTEILLFRQVWDERGYLQAHWPQIRNVHLNRLRTLDLLYSKAKGLWDNYLQGELVLTRRYLNAVHRILGLLWILERNTVPPIAIDELLETCANVEVLLASRRLLGKYRRQSLDKEIAWTEPEPVIHHYLATRLEMISAAVAIIGERESDHLLNACLMLDVNT